MINYIIDGIRYQVGEENLICEAQSAITFEQQYLYYPKKKAFLLVIERELTEPLITVISEDKAFSFMNQHTAGIHEKNYIKFFGEPKEL